MTDRDVAAARTPARKRARPRVSADYFRVLGVGPALGRFYDAADERPGASPTVVLWHALWRERFGADPAAIGRTVTVDGRAATVVGVAPPDFSGLDFARVDLWLPIMAVHGEYNGDHSLTNNTMGWLTIVARRRAGVSDARAAAEAEAAYREGDAAGEYPDAKAASATRIRLGPVQAARGPDGGDARRLALWLALMSSALLVAAAANATGLLLARALERRRAVAVRRALGARARDLARGAGAEAAVLAAGCAALAAAVAGAFGAAARGWVLGDAFATLPVLDARRLAVVAALAVAVCLTAALVATAVAARGVGGASVLHPSGSRTATRAGGRTLGALVAGQVALTFVLLVGAGLFAASLRRALAARIGYDAGRVLLVQIDAAPGADDAAQRTLYAEADARLAAVPGVEGVARSFMTPLHGVNGVRLRVPGLDTVPAMPGGGPFRSDVSPNYFAVSGTRLLAGRAAAAPPNDTAFGLPRGPREVVVSALTTRTLWPGRDPIGRCVYLGDVPGCATVVGVAEDARRFELVEGRALQVYVAADFSRHPYGALLVRTRGAADARVPAVRGALAGLGAALGEASVRPMAADFAPKYGPFRAGASLLGAFGALALALAGAGVFGALSYALAQRRRELGVRLALGARGRDVAWLLARGGLAPVAAGLAAGVPLALAGGRAARALLYGVSPADPRAALAGAGVLLATAALACWFPARRAGRVPPAVVLRAD